MIYPLQISTYCSGGCFHCPFDVSGKHFTESFEIIENSICIITGGEPFENEKGLFLAIRLLEEKKSYYRIATGGHIPLKRFYVDLVSRTHFLGVNFGTDILLRNNNNRFRKIWKENWLLFRNFKKTWLTFTLDDSLKLPRIERLINILKPSSVLLNEIDSGFRDFDKSFNTLVQKYPEIYFMEGYRYEDS